MDGKIYSYSVNNIREWSTYILRCYYQKRFLGRVSFANVFNDRQEITLDDLPLTVSAISPEGSKEMKRIFVRTNTLKYKLRTFCTLVMVKLKRLYNKFNN